MAAYGHAEEGTCKEVRLPMEGEGAALVAVVVAEEGRDSLLIQENVDRNDERVDDGDKGEADVRLPDYMGHQATEA